MHGDSLTPDRTREVSADDAVAQELVAARLTIGRLETHFRATIEQLPIGIAHVETHDRITRVNTAFCRMLGFAAEELIGKCFADITHPDDLPGSASALQRLWRGEVDSYAIEKRYIKKNGTFLWARVTAAPIRDVDGSLHGAIGILEDITERKAAEVEMARVHQELLRASHAAGMAEIANNVLHNVGNVLNSLNVSATLLASHVRGSKLDVLARVATLLQDNTNDLAMFLTEDTRGQCIPAFLTQLSTHMLTAQTSALSELTSLLEYIEHIKAIVAAQQTYAKSTRRA